MTDQTAQHPAAPETDVSALTEAIGLSLYESLMEASADAWRRWEFLTDAAKEKYRAEAARIVAVAVRPALLADLTATRERLRVVEGELEDAWASRSRAREQAHDAVARAESAEAALANLEADYDNRGERLWRLAAKAGHVPSSADNDASAELTVADALAERDALRAGIEALAARMVRSRHRGCADALRALLPGDGR